MMRLNRALLVCSVALAISLSTAPVHAKDVGQSWLEPLIPNAQMRGAGLFRVFGFKIYEASLFTDAKFDAKKWQEHSLALKLSYLREVTALQISESSAKEMRRLSLGTPTQIEAWQKQMTTLFVNVKNGDSLTGIYKPGGPTAVFLNHQRLGDIADPEFGVAFFSIWFDSKTKDQSLRQALLHVEK